MIILRHGGTAGANFWARSARAASVRLDMAASLLVGLLICRGAALSMDVHLRDLDHDLIDVDRIVPFAHQVGGHRVGDGRSGRVGSCRAEDDPPRGCRQCRVP